MFRANTVEESSRVVITIDGELSAEYVDVVKECCEQASAAGKPVRLLLRDVSIVDEAGRQLLRSLATRGVCLRANGVYNTYLIREYKSAL